MPHFSPSPTRMTTTCKGHGARNGPVGIADAETAQIRNARGLWACG